MHELERRHRDPKLGDALLQIRPPVHQIVDVGGLGLYRHRVGMEFTAELFDGGHQLIEVGLDRYRRT